MKQAKKILSLFILLLITSLCHSQNLSGVVIYINPGHGGYDSDDRNMVIPPYTQGDPNGFWESQSNLDKGLQLRDLLRSANATTYMSRLTNTTADDLPLSQIVAEANECNADYMLSIHSNAGVTNYILQLYAGVDPGDTETYPSPPPCSDRSREISSVIAKHQYSNEVNCWASNYTVRGDKTFARLVMGWSNGYGVLRGLAVPGCISEGSMHDYIPETMRLMNMEYKWLEAWHFYKSFCEVFDGGTIASGNIAGSVHDSRNKNLDTYVKIRGSKDELLCLSNAVITVNPGNLTYTTDAIINNGVFVFKQLAPGKYTVNVSAPDYFSENYELEVKAGETTYLNSMLNKQRLTPPEVIDYSPKVSEGQLVGCGSKFVFDFNWDVDEQSAIKAFSIEPHVEGTITFSDSQHRMTFSPNQPLAISTDYTITIDKSLKHPGNISMLNDFVLKFTTANRNRLVMLAAYPTPDIKEVHYGKVQFDFRFDNKLNTVLAREGLKVYNSKGEEMTKAPRSIKLNSIGGSFGSFMFNLSENLVENETYRVVIDRNMMDVDDIDIVDTYDYTFKAVNMAVSNQPVAIEINHTDEFAFNSSKSAEVASFNFSLATDKKLFGNASCKLIMNFVNDAGHGVMHYNLKSSVDVTNRQAIGLHLAGDLTGNEVWLHFKDDSNGLESIKADDLTFNDWKFIEVDLKSLAENKHYQLSGLSIRQKQQPLTKSGIVYVDNVLLYDKKDTGIIIGESNELNLYYDAQQKLLSVDSEEVKSMKLYTIGGTLIQQTTLCQMKVDHCLPDIYIVEVELQDNKIITQKIIIR